MRQPATPEAASGAQINPMLIRFFLSLVLLPLRAVLYFLTLPLRNSVRPIGRATANRVVRVYRRAGSAAEELVGVRDPRFPHPVF